ncbi:peptidoglycan-binding protein [Kribbella sp. NPDC058245]|uniref:peptidoglycan-binding protein n=1 Tax=Kribbella sp. NPDC058245 TaxID=3346399 RepID=UPI0036E1DD78
MARRRRRAGRVVIAVVAVVAAGAGAAAATGVLDGRQPTQSAAETPAATAKVTRQTLVDKQTESGELGHGAPVVVSAKLSGTLTALAAIGSTIGRGDTVYRVDDTPVVLLYGALPAYRNLVVGTEGTDVAQFENNLAALGYTGFTADRQYTQRTAAAVKKWQKALGLPQTGTVEQGRIYYATGPVRVDSQEAVPGSGVGPDAPLLKYTGSARLVTVSMDVADERLAVKGAVVTVTLPDGKTVRGTIGDTKTIVVPADGSPGSNASTRVDVTVTVADQKALAGLDRASVKVGFTAAQRKNVLTVPVAALLALSEGGYGVEVVNGSTTKTVAVKTGLFADGRVEISGDGVAEGATVGMPS